MATRTTASSHGKTIGGVPVHNVAVSLLMAQNPPWAYRVVEV